MLATTFEHKKPTGYGRFFSVIKPHLNSPRSIAIVITLTLHLMILWAAINSKFLFPNDTITPHLHYIEVIQSVAPVTLQIVEPPVVHFKSNTITLQPLPEITVQSEPLTPQELKELLGDDDFPLQINTAEIAKNVFHPGLRKKLTDEANKPVLARVEDRGLETYTDPSGATIVVSASGSCLSSPAAKIGEPRNWYMVPCAGKNESEKAMDRIDEAVNGKLQFK